MALRVSEIEVGGKRIRFGNLQLRPLRVFNEELEAIQKPGAERTRARLTAATQAVVLAAIQRADPAFTREQLEELDGDDIAELFTAVMSWAGRGQETPQDPPQSP